MWMSREEATKCWMEEQFGEGVDCVIAGHEVTCYGNDECFELDEHYQFGVKADGTILQFYYDFPVEVPEHE